MLGCTPAKAEPSLFTSGTQSMHRFIGQWPHGVFAWPFPFSISALGFNQKCWSLWEFGIRMESMVRLDKFMTCGKVEGADPED